MKNSENGETMNMEEALAALQELGADAVTKDQFDAVDSNSDGLINLEGKKFQIFSQNFSFFKLWNYRLNYNCIVCTIYMFELKLKFFSQILEFRKLMELPKSKPVV